MKPDRKGGREKLGVIEKGEETIQDNMQERNLVAIKGEKIIETRCWNQRLNGIGSHKNLKNSKPFKAPIGAVGFCRGSVLAGNKSKR